MQLSLFTVMPMLLVLASASAESHLRGLQAKDPRPPNQDSPILDDFWNDSRQSCNACGGFWPTTQPANCHDRWGIDLTQCGAASPAPARPPAPTTTAPTTSPTSAPTTSPTEPIILTPTITYTCVGATCSDGSDGSTCGSDGGCCPFGDTPSDGQCSCGTSWSDANMNKIPCKLTQQQPEPQPETASPTSNPTTNAPTKAPTSAPSNYVAPTESPTTTPNPEPTFAPSSKPSGGPSNSPPSTNPSLVPTAPITQPPTREDCPICTSSTVIEVSGNDFRKKIQECLGGNCQDDVPIGCWDTSKVTDMEKAFYRTALFKNSINCWNTARVTNMVSMFERASNFNHALNDWNVASVNNMRSMFLGTNFNKPLDDWNVASVTSMEYMFEQATEFNQSLNDWNVASVNDMAYMFKEASNFNQPLDDWNVASVNDMISMFSEAYNFNQCLSSWAGKALPDVKLGSTFSSSGCPDQNPVVNGAPWCQGEGEQCSAPPTRG